MSLLPATDFSQPHMFIKKSGDVLDCNWIGRFVRLRYTLKRADGSQKHVSKILYTVGPPQSTSAGSYNVLQFAPIPTSYWEIEDMSDPLWGEAQNSLATGDEPVCTLELLPFVMNEPSPGVYGEEETNSLSAQWTSFFVPSTHDVFRSTLGKPCYIEVLLDADAFYVPPSYLLDPANGETRYNPAGSFPPTASINQPYDGQILDLFGAQNEGTVTEGLGEPLVEAGDPLGDGPHPIYWLDDEGLAGFGKYFDPILAAGVHLETLIRNFCLFEGEDDS